MKRIMLLFLITLGLLFSYQTLLLAVTSTDMIEKGAQYDQKTIVYEGEVIREMMVRGNYAWLNVSDGSNAIGVWVKREMLQPIKYLGSYKTKGDWVKITGIYHRSCPDHGGDLDIHATSINVPKYGGPIIRPVRVERLLLMVFMLICTMLFWMFKYSKRKSNK